MVLAKIGMQIVYNRASQTICGEELIFFQSLTDQYYSKKRKLTRSDFFKKEKIQAQGSHSWLSQQYHTAIKVSKHSISIPCLSHTDSQQFTDHTHTLGSTGLWKL